MTIDQEVQLAQQHLQNGNASQCETVCLNILRQFPGHPHASYLLAQVKLRGNRPDLAAEIYRNAIALHPGVAELHCELGVCLARMSRIDDAIATWQQAAQLKPGYAEVLDNLGSAHRLLGRFAEAAAFHEQAITARPDFAPAYLNLGIALQSASEYQSALHAFQRALELHPADPAAFSGLGVSYHNLGQFENAIAAYRNAIALEPGAPQHHFNLAMSLHRATRFAEAIAAYRNVLHLNPAHAPAQRYLANALLMNGDLAEAIQSLTQILESTDEPASVLTDLGAAYRRMLQIDQAIEALQKAVALAPQDGEILSQLAEALRAAGRLPEAAKLISKAVRLNPDSHTVMVSHAVILADTGDSQTAAAMLRRAIESKPDDAVAHFNLSAHLLADDQYEQGLDEFEWRWKAHPHSMPLHQFRQPRWDGSDFTGKRILLYAEQGFGDTIQFARYASLVADRGATVLLAVQPELKQLLSRCTGVHGIYKDDPSTFDVHFPLLSLPHLFKTRSETIPATVPYIAADPAAIAKWRKRLGDACGAGLKVGLVWSGRPYPPGRSVPLEALAPLANVEGVSFVSVQFGQGIDRLGAPGSQVRVADTSREIVSFDELAAALMNLDLLITIDTAAAHLAGAMAVPVWMMLPHVADWRWRRAGERSPWYPTMRLFRQEQLNSWEKPLEDIRRELELLVANRHNKPVTTQRPR